LSSDLFNCVAKEEGRCQAAMASDDEQQQPLHILFFPYIAHGLLV
jgi:hypothetical protein